MAFQITSGKISRGKKIVVYGPEGIGKSTFAAQFPGAVFIDTEGSTVNMDVARYPRPESWQALMAMVDDAIRNRTCGTLVIDTADWAEKLCITDVCKSHNTDGLEGFNYGKGHVYVGESFGKLLNRLEDAANVGINLCVTAHALMRKFEEPNASSAYDRWELKLTKQCGAMLKEWADALLFANYKVTVVKPKDGKAKGTGGQRVMYCTHNPCWDAKNRYGMPDELPFDFKAIAQLFGNSEQLPRAAEVQQESVTRCESAAPAPQTAEPSFIEDIPEDEPAPAPEIRLHGVNAEQIPDDIPKNLAQLMAADGIDEEQIRWVVSTKGFYPYATQISKYDPDFIEGWIIKFWPNIVNMIATKAAGRLPF